MKKNTVKLILISTLINIIPILIGIILIFIVKNRPDLFEIILSVFGLAYLIAFTIRLNHNVKVKRDNKINNKEIVNFERDSYYKKTQIVLLVSSLSLLIIALIYFLIMKKTGGYYA